MVQKRISIIIPFFNTHEFITDCLNSILNQNYDNFEVLLINDGSTIEETERLEEIIQNINDHRIVYIKNQKNEGVGYSRNLGVKEATGEYVFFLDSDDLLAENALADLIEHIQDYPMIKGETKSLVRPSDLETDEGSSSQGQASILENSSTVLKDGSVTNLLFNRTFLIENSLAFSESTKGYTDLSMTVPILQKVGKIPVFNKITYFKRERNDPISKPSLDQGSLIERAKDFIHQYQTLHDRFKDDSLVASYLDHLLLQFYKEHSLKLFLDEDQKQESYQLFRNAFQAVNPNLIHEQSYLIKREIQALLNDQEKKFRNRIAFHREAIEFKNGIKGFTRLKNYIYNKILTKLPIRENYIVFESFLGKNYSDSPRNIYEYIDKHHPEFKCIWMFSEKRKIPGKGKVVKRFSLGYYYYMAVSKYWVNNMRQPLHLKKREENIFLETWHGTPLKKLVFDIKDIHSANPKYKEHFYKQSRAWDYLLSPNGYSSEIFRRAFKFDKEMLEFGYPRNDLLYAPDKEERARKIKEQIGIPQDKKVILYAPTWRDDEFYTFGKYKFTLKLDLHALKKKLGDEYVVALRTHYFIADDLKLDGLDGFAFNLSKYDDIAELYLIADLLITDYSSVFFDYANLKRPILFYTYDLEKYRDQLRGFYLDFENEAPGPLLKTTEEVIESIQQIDKVKEDYKDKYDHFYEQFCSWHDGNSTKKVVERVFF